MGNPFVASLQHNFDFALNYLETAMQECPDELWETDLWPEQEAQGSTEYGVGGTAPWNLAYHALSVGDYDLTGDFEMWIPPEPILSNQQWSIPKRVFTKPELLEYHAYFRERVNAVLAGLTEELAARPLPDTHRYKGTPYVVNTGSIPVHVTEHASQIKQFITANGVAPPPRGRSF